MRLIALKEHPYPWYTKRKVGEEYDAPEGDATVMVAVKNAKYAPLTEDGPRPVYDVRVEDAEEKPEIPQVRNKRKYQKKEMTPQE